MHPPGAETVVIRYGDMSTKSREVRSHFERLLTENIEALLADRGVEGEVERIHARVLVEGPDPEAAARAAADAFGVVSTSPARTVAPEWDAIEDALREAARERFPGGTFAVRANRAAEFPMTSEEMERAGGTAVGETIEASGGDPDVDLEDPDVTFGVELREDRAFVFLDRFDGPGGLPLGSQAPLVAMVSGGQDSPVAAYEAMRRGSPVIPVYVDLGDYGGADHRARAIETVGRLARYAPDRDTRVRVVPGGEDVAHLVETVERGRMLSWRRYVLRVGAAIARDHDAAGVVTGEAVGQKSSQTARNLQVTDAAVDLPVHRPLLSRDKNQITERAKEVGTFRDSTIPAGCTRIAPPKPETNGRLDRLLQVEPDDLLERAERAAAEAELVDPREFGGDVP